MCDDRLDSSTLRRDESLGQFTFPDESALRDHPFAAVLERPLGAAGVHAGATIAANT
jgi:hypothetical protein